MFLIKNNFNFSLELRHTLLIGLKATVNEVHVYHKHLFSFLMQKFQFMLPQKCFFLQCKFFFYILKTCSNSSNTIEDPHLKSSTYTFAFKLEWYAQLHLYRLMSWFKKSEISSGNFSYCHYGNPCNLKYGNIYPPDIKALLHAKRILKHWIINFGSWF